MFVISMYWFSNWLEKSSCTLAVGRREVFANHAVVETVFRLTCFVVKELAMAK
jgi:hypothetical protein